MSITIKVGILLGQSDLWGRIPSFWQPYLDQQEVVLVTRAIGDNYHPSIDNIFRALETPPEQIKVVILGQDPYPQPSHATGLAFSVPKDLKVLPASLRNIYQELFDDLGVKRQSGDLSDWVDQGVMLLNRSLSIGKDGAESHRKKGWSEITLRVVKTVAQSGAVGVLWGRDAQEMSSYFHLKKILTSAHPSPLSAYRGFFGSKPFSKINQILLDQGDQPIIW